MTCIVYMHVHVHVRAIIGQNVACWCLYVTASSFSHSSLDLSPSPSLSLDPSCPLILISLPPPPPHLSLQLTCPLYVCDSLPLTLPRSFLPLNSDLSQHVYNLVHGSRPPSLSPPSSTPFFTLQVRTYVRTVRES